MSALQLLQKFDALRVATLAARVRCGDSSIGTNVEAGRVNIVSVTYPRGRKTSVVKTLIAGLSLDEAVDQMNAMKAVRS